ncbi:cation transporter [Acidobacteria bacterium AH-259-A15]|nr:cation transporter [Acidobacteria bacterium AH-259-A15]
MIKAIIITALAGTIALGVWINPECCLLSSSAASETAGDAKTAVFRVSGMTCGGCEVGVRMAVKKLDGIHKVEASYKEGKATVKYDPSKVKPEEIKAAIEKIGYKAKVEKKEERNK